MGKTDALVEVSRGQRGFTLSCGGVEATVVAPPEGGCARLVRTTEGDGSLADFAAIALTLAKEVAHCDELLSWDEPRRVRLHTALQQAGFRAFRRKLLVTRDLTDSLPRGGDFTWRTLAEVGEDAFIALMTRAGEGDPFPAADFDPRREWRELLEHAGASFDPQRWRVAIVDDEPVGVVLPTPYPEAPDEGTLSYVGVLPAFRGRGLGSGLHASGLRLLADAGCRVYRGSTDERNTAMARVFERNDCPVTGVQVFLRPPK